MHSYCGEGQNCSFAHSLAPCGTRYLCLLAKCHCARYTFLLGEKGRRLFLMENAEFK